MSQAEPAAVFGINQSAVSDYETGEARIHPGAGAPLCPPTSSSASRRRT
jgi:hypothetical protein